MRSSYRQLWDGKASIDLTHLTARGLTRYAEACAMTLARAHARSGFRISIAAYLGDTDEFDQAIADLAAGYADVNEADYARLAEATADGVLPVAFDDNPTRPRRSTTPRPSASTRG